MKGLLFVFIPYKMLAMDKDSVLAKESNDLFRFLVSNHVTTEVFNKSYEYYARSELKNSHEMGCVSISDSNIVFCICINSEGVFNENSFIECLNSVESKLDDVSTISYCPSIKIKESIDLGSLIERTVDTLREMHSSSEHVKDQIFLEMVNHVRPKSLH